MSTGSSVSPDYKVSWIKSFCTKKGNKFFCEVNECYILDSFNLVGLEEKVHHYQEALNIILSRPPESENDEPSDESEITTKNCIDSAETLYGLIHARYILTLPGILEMYRKYIKGDFGYCPRVYCDNQKMLPIDMPHQHYVKTYCPKCMEVYKPLRCRHVDGAFFGTGFPHLFFMILPKYRPKPPEKKFVARLFGFKIHSRAYKLQEKAAVAAQIKK